VLLEVLDGAVFSGGLGRHDVVVNGVDVLLSGRLPLLGCRLLLGGSRSLSLGGRCLLLVFLSLIVGFELVEMRWIWVLVVHRSLSLALGGGLWRLGGLWCFLLVLVLLWSLLGGLFSLLGAHFFFFGDCYGGDIRFRRDGPNWWIRFAVQIRQ